MRSDLGLSGSQYSWISSIIYVGSVSAGDIAYQKLTLTQFGAIVAVLPSLFLMQCVNTAKYIAFNCSVWGIILMASAGAKSFGYEQRLSIPSLPTHSVLQRSARRSLHIGSLREHHLCWLWNYHQCVVDEGRAALADRRHLQHAVLRGQRPSVLCSFKVPWVTRTVAGPLPQCWRHHFRLGNTLLVLPCW